MGVYKCFEGRCLQLGNPRVVTEFIQPSLPFDQFCVTAIPAQSGPELTHTQSTVGNDSRWTNPASHTMWGDI